MNYNEMIADYVRRLTAVEAALIEEACEVAMTTPPAGIGVRVHRDRHGMLITVKPDPTVPPMQIHEHRDAL